MNDPLLSGLNPEQLQAVIHIEGPLLIFAGAGSGKTRVITHRAAYLVREGLAHPWEILCVTFTNKAALEMRERIERLCPGVEGFRVSTFHSFGLDLIRQGVHPPGIYSGSTVLDEEDQKDLMGELCKELNLDPRVISPQSLLQRIEGFKNLVLTPEEVEERLWVGIPMTKIYSAYEQRLRELRALDFEDLIFLPVLALKGSSELRDSFSQRYRFIMVDEYQDTNPAQYHLIRLLAEKHKNLCVVGDDDQAIYRWRGADIRNILEFERDFPNATVIRLERNYRSTQVILDAAWGVVRNNRYRREKRLYTEEKGGEKIYLTSFFTPRSEAEWVAERIIKEKEKGVPYSGIAVFYRINAQSRVLEESLRRARIPYRIYGNIGFYERKEIKDLIAYLRLLRNPYDWIAFERATSFPRQGIGEITLRKIREVALGEEKEIFSAVDALLGSGRVSGSQVNSLKGFYERWIRIRERMVGARVSEVASAILSTFEFYPALEKEYGPEVALDRRENLEEFLLSIEQWEENNPEGTLSQFLDEILLVQEAGARPGEEAVSLMTLHSAKGLEFHTVFIVGFEEELLPHARSQENPQELEEERRLLYVGITRARRRVYLSHTRMRPFARGGERPSYPSRFLREIPSQLLEDLSLTTPPPPSFPLFSPSAEGRKLIYRVGDRLEHPLFGVGTVVAIEEGSSGLRLTIRFPHGTKTILPRYVELRKVGG